MIRMPCIRKPKAECRLRYPPFPGAAARNLPVRPDCQELPRPSPRPSPPSATSRRAPLRTGRRREKPERSVHRGPLGTLGDRVERCRTWRVREYLEPGARVCLARQGSTGTGGQGGQERIQAGRNAVSVSAGSGPADGRWQCTQSRVPGTARPATEHVIIPGVFEGEIVMPDSQ